MDGVVHPGERFTVTEEPVMLTADRESAAHRRVNGAGVQGAF
jgi:hypothetical protein